VVVTFPNYQVEYVAAIELVVVLILALRLIFLHE
jgi:hypothetical protein